MKPIRYTQAMIDEFKRDGFWTDEIFFDFYVKNAREIPEQEALVDSKYRVNWREATALINAIATAWAQAGVPKDARVIIQSPNSVYGFLARVAAERAGLISLTVYPYLRQRELEYMMDLTQAEMVVIPHVYRKFDYLEMYKGFMRQFPSLKKIYLFDEDIPAAAPEGTQSLVKVAQEYLGKIDEKLLDSRRLDATGDVAILTTTTGTTGIPKLVEWPCAPRVCTAKGRIDIWDLTNKDRTMAVAPHAGGAAGTLTYFAAPMAGAATIMLEEFDPKLALEIMSKEKATAIGVVPTHLIRMLEEDIESYDLSALRFIRSAGGYLPPKVGKEAEERFQAAITSDLGTQDVGSVSGCRVTDSQEVRRGSVGRPLPGNKVKILDDDGKELPEGEPGQLWFRGPNAPAGYYRDEKLTATVFDDNAWSTTGDIVKLEKDCLWIMGRKKDMIIRGGQNIYPAEIEGMLNNHPKVSSVAVVGMPDEEMGERTCAYVIPKAGETFTFQDMKDFLLSKQIAKYKLPERLEIVADMPTVGDSGKVNKEDLKKDIAAKLQAEKKA